MTTEANVKQAVLDHIFGPAAYVPEHRRLPRARRERMLLLRYEGQPDTLLEQAIRTALGGFGFAESDRVFDFHLQRTEMRFDRVELRSCDEPSAEEQAAAQRHAEEPVDAE